MDEKGSRGKGGEAGEYGLFSSQSCSTRSKRRSVVRGTALAWLGSAGLSVRLPGLSDRAGKGFFAVRSSQVARGGGRMDGFCRSPARQTLAVKCAAACDMLWSGDATPGAVQATALLLGHA